MGSSFGPSLPLLDVRLVATDDLNLFSPVLERLRDRLPWSSHRMKKSPDETEELSHRAEKS